MWKPLWFQTDSTEPKTVLKLEVQTGSANFALHYRNHPVIPIPTQHGIHWWNASNRHLSVLSLKPLAKRIDYCTWHLVPHVRLILIRARK